ncbi:hypothetical protein B9Z19DRAFT_998399 [Tuber borchii]|uniref:Uncharacterized protein n=1 Tax=Tuber borchii TaxID=42251 RepID=A0A2T6ZH27_TUBBO|nr:hypothetical protein B9Z19DRAFT_998399 [Tuber borchii]
MSVMDAATELKHLKFTPRTSAWKHMQRFERLCSLAYPRATDAGKWSLFVKTIDTTNVWGTGRGMTPGRWLMDLSEDWLRKNPHCSQPDCTDCKHDSMSFDYLRTAFLDRWGATNTSPHGNLRQPMRSHSMPPPSESDGDPAEMITPSDIVSNALIPRGGSSHYNPPAAPTPPNEPVSERERLVQETKTSIAINPAGNGGGQIVLQITDNNKPRKRKKEIKATIDTPPPQHSMHEGSLPDSPRDRDYHDRDYHPDDRDAYRSDRDERDHRIPRDHRTQHHDRERSRHRDGVHVIEAEPPVLELIRQPSPQSDGRHDNSQALVEVASSEVDESTVTGDALLTAPSQPVLRPRLLEGKICAITGASRGIGRAIALGFAKEGANIIAHYWGTKSDPANEEIVSLCVEIRSMGQGCTIVFGDISDPRTSDNIVKRAVETYGRLDVAVGNAGMCWYREFLDVTPELLRRHVDVNLNGNFYFVQACARQFKEQFHAMPIEPRPDPIPDYSIIFISSASALSGNGHQSHYNPTSAGVLSLMQSTTISLGPYGVRCNALLPGVVQTKMNREELQDMEKRGRLEKKVPLGRLGVPSDVVGPAVWLASDGAKYVSGAQITVDGGAFVNN